MSTRETLELLCITYLRPVDQAIVAADGSFTHTFTPPLTVAEQAVYTDLTTMARFGVSLTLAEWQAVKPDAAALKTYLGVASPTAAQTAAAAKAIIRVLATIVRT